MITPTSGKTKNLSVLAKLYQIVPPVARRSLVGLMVIALLKAGLEVVSLGGVFLFLTCLADPEASTLVIPVLGEVALPAEAQSKRLFLARIGLAVAGVFILTTCLGSLLSWLNHRFNLTLGHALSCRLLAAYMGMPYEWFLQKNSAVLSKEVLSNRVLEGILLPLVSIAVNSVLTVVMVGVVLLVDPLVTVVVLVVAVGSYGLLHYFSQSFFSRLGRVAHEAEAGRFQSTFEALAGIKPLKVQGREQAFLERFERESERNVETQSRRWLVGGLPGTFLHLLAFAGLILLAVGLLISGKGLRTVLPMLGIYALAGQRLLPVLQSISQQLSSIQWGLPALDEYFDSLAGERPAIKPHPKLALREEFALREVTFRYPERAEPALDKVTLRVPRGRSIGVVGPTGSGKTTLVDLILGLLEPSEGWLEVDGQRVDPNQLSAWRENIGYVAQEIFLVDDTVEANITLGLAATEVDGEAVERAARLARIHDFIVSDLPKGYQTRVGERGVRLSGGQRQRIGIARALYRDPEVLVFDEATSALDGVTEASVMEAIQELSSLKTVIIIAHRLATVERCQQLCLLENGRVTHSGTYCELLEQSSLFRSLVREAGLSKGVAR